MYIHLGKSLSRNENRLRFNIIPHQLSKPLASSLYTVPLILIYYTSSNYYPYPDIHIYPPLTSHTQLIYFMLTLIYPTITRSSSWSWSYGSWIYNYMWNQCLSPLTLCVRITFMARCTRYSTRWYSLSLACDSLLVFSEYSGFPHQ